MRDFKDLTVWQKSHQLALKVYEVTASFPRDEQFGLISQLRRAAVSVGSNIAEGCGRDGAVELSRFCRIAMGSATELEYQLLLARDLGFLAESSYQDAALDVMEVKKMLTGFIRSLAASRSPSVIEN